MRISKKIATAAAALAIAACQMNQHNAHDRPHRRPDGKRITPAAWPKPYRIAPDLPPAAQAPPRQSPATDGSTGAYP